jgi:hypothetical protein
MPPRAPGPHLRLDSEPSAADPAWLPDPPQSAPAAPIPARSRAAETVPEPINLDQYRVRKQAHVGGLINEYRLVASRGRGSRHAQPSGHRPHQSRQQRPPTMTRRSSCRSMHPCSAGRYSAVYSTSTTEPRSRLREPASQAAHNAFGSATYTADGRSGDSRHCPAMHCSRRLQVSRSGTGRPRCGSRPRPPCKPGGARQ